MHGTNTRPTQLTLIERSRAKEAEGIHGVRSGLGLCPGMLGSNQIDSNDSSRAKEALSGNERDTDAPSTEDS